MNKAKVISVFMILSTLWSFGQFNTTGTAVAGAGCNEFDITPNSNNQTGSMYSLAPVNLNADFSLLFKVNFGCDGFGGEGLAFVLQPGIWATGTGDFGMGYQGLTNTVAIEFDTRDNQASGQTTNFDIPGDHVSIMSNGNINHNLASCLTGLPLDPISTLVSDVEDCQDHMIEIIWTAGVSQTLEVKVDGATSITHTSNMIANDLSGISVVNWGWTGSTSIFSNKQSVQVALCPFFGFSATNCPGQLINFTDASLSQNTIVQWDWDFDGFIMNNAGPTPSYTFVTAGNHPVTLTVTDDQGCTSDTIVDVGVGFEVTATADNLLICPGTDADLLAEGNPFVGNTCCFELHCYDFWDDGWGSAEVEIFVDGASQGTYFHPNNGNGLTSTEIYTFCWDIGAVIDLTVNISGGSQPQESAMFLVDAAGDTLVEILSDFMSGSGTWVDGASVQYTVDCGVAPPAYTYSWDNVGDLNLPLTADPTATVNTMTTYTVDVTDPNTGCVIQESVTIDVYPEPTAVISGNETVCQGDDADLTITFTGPTPYTVDIAGPGGPINITGIMASPYTLSVQDDGNYTITAYTGNGCAGNPVGSGTGIVTVIIPPNVSIATDATYCDGDPLIDLTVTSANGGNVDWYNNAALNPPILATGNTFTPGATIGATTYYAAESELVLGCQGPSDQVTITINPVPAAPAVTGNTIYCEGDIPIPNVAIPTSGGNITWYDNPLPATIVSTFDDYAPTLVVGTFSFYVTETALGCESPATQVTYTVKPTPGAPAVSGTTLYCEGDVPTDLTAAPNLGGQISWENTSNIQLGTGATWTPPLVNGATIYWVYEELNGCQSDSTEVTINVDAAPAVNVTPELYICAGDSVQVTASNNGYAITWDDGQTGETVFLGPDTTTIFVVTATNPSCGFAEDSITIHVNPLPDILAGNDTLIGIGGEVTLWAESSGIVTFSWIPDVDECVETNCSVIYDVPDQATLYVVFALDQNGCENTDSVLVDINGYMDVFVPNIFSPNGDGFNDNLQVYGPRLFNYQIEIYDRWGKRVFRSDEQKDYWDGTINGSNLSPQTFVYMLSGETVLGERIVQEGNVSIIK
ncbi:MAG: gliding motility-associated-like protein [Arenicella sp.]|jgi:gliding motility-associated-like protein